MNETSFLDLNSALDDILANITNSPPYSVTSAFIELVSTITSRNIYLSDGTRTEGREKRSNDNSALINVVIAPTDTNHEEDVMYAMNDTASFISDINSGLQALSSGNITVISVSQIQRIAGKLIDDEMLLHTLN